MDKEKRSVGKDSKVTIKDLADRCNISEQTYYNWKKDKPELIKLINMGLDMERLLKKHKN